MYGFTLVELLIAMTLTAVSYTHLYGDPEAIGMARDAVGSLDIPTPKGKGAVHLISLSLSLIHISKTFPFIESLFTFFLCNMGLSFLSGDILQENAGKHI